MPAFRKHILYTLASVLATLLLLGALTPPKAKATVYFDSDLMSSQGQLSWVITNIIRTIITDVKEEHIPDLNVTPDTRQSILKLRKAYIEKTSNVDMNSLSDMAYAYSYRHAALYTYLGAWAPELLRKINDLDRCAEQYDLWREHKMAISGVTIASLGIASLAASYGAFKYCSKPALLMTRLTPTAITGGVTSLWGKTTTVLSVLTPWVLYPIATGAYLTKVLGDYYIAGPDALKYYTKKLVGDYEDAYTSNTTAEVYGYIYEDAPVYFDYYLNAALYYDLQKNLLSHKSLAHPVVFEDINEKNRHLLWRIHNKGSLTTSKTGTIKICHDLTTGKEEDTAAIEKECLKENEDTIKQVLVNEECVKYTFFNENNRLKDEPLMLVSVCNPSGDDDSYLQLPNFGFAHVHKSAVSDVLYRISRYTGATKVVAQQ